MQGHLDFEEKVQIPPNGETRAGILHPHPTHLSMKNIEFEEKICLYILSLENHKWQDKRWCYAAWALSEFIFRKYF